jgi:hypothetical protein
MIISGHRAPHLSPTGIVRNVMGAADAALPQATIAASAKAALDEKNAKLMAQCPLAQQVATWRLLPGALQHRSGEAVRRQLAQAHSTRVRATPKKLARNDKGWP